MKKAVIFLVIVCLCAAAPSVSFTEDAAAVRLAKTLYALAGDDSYDTMLALGTVVMNRVDSPWYPSNLSEVLSQQHAFPCGSRYDEMSLRAAHDVISGERTLSADVIAYQPKDASSPRPNSEICAESGNYNFYITDMR